MTHTGFALGNLIDYARLVGRVSTFAFPRTVRVNNSDSSPSNGNGSLATIAATATALPPHLITRDDVKYYMGRVFDIPERRLDAMMSIVDNAAVHQRHAIFPIDYTIEPRPLSQTNNEYIEHAIKLGREAAEKCLSRARLCPEDIDLIITVSCTGFMIPSLDAHLIHLMGFRSDIRRMPFTELVTANQKLRKHSDARAWHISDCTNRSSFAKYLGISPMEKSSVGFKVALKLVLVHLEIDPFWQTREMRV